MSHIGKKPIQVPEGVEVSIKDSGEVMVKGKLGELSFDFNPKLLISNKDSQINVDIPVKTKKFKELHGLTRALIANMVEGVSAGFSKELSLVGVGFTADASKGNYLILSKQKILFLFRFFCCFSWLQRAFSAIFTSQYYYYFRNQRRNLRICISQPGF